MPLVHFVFRRCNVRHECHVFCLTSNTIVPARPSLSLISATEENQAYHILLILHGGCFIVLAYHQCSDGRNARALGPDHSQCHRSPPRCTARSFPHKLEYKEFVVDELEQRLLVISKVFDIFAAGDELKLQKHTVRTTGTDLCFM